MDESLEVVNDLGERRQVALDTRALLETGQYLLRRHPDTRLKLSRHMTAQHADHVVVLLRDWLPNECVKFLVFRQHSLGLFKHHVARVFQLPQPFHIVFDGVSYPDSNSVAEIFSAQARDDDVLHGYLVPLDVQTHRLLYP